MSSTLQDFLKASQSFFLLVREKRVPSKEAVDSLMQLLNNLAAEYDGHESLPKSLVGIMLDVSTALYSSVDFHPEPTRSILYAQFDLITDKMRELCLR